MLQLVVLSYIKTSLTLFSFYLKLSFYAVKNGYVFCAFFYFLGAMSKFLFLPISEFFVDIASLFIDREDMEIIAKDFLNE